MFVNYICEDTIYFGYMQINFVSLFVNIKKM